MGLQEKIGMMSRKLEKLEKDNYLLKRELELIAMIDYIRDRIEEPKKMREAIAKGLLRKFNKFGSKAIGCLISIAEEGNDKKIIPDVSSGVYFYNLRNQKTKKVNDSFKLFLSVEKESSGIVHLQDGICAMGSLIQLQKETLGMIVLLSRNTFSDDDLMLLKSVEDHIDSAIIQNRKFYQMQRLLDELTQEKKINDAIKRIDTIRDMHLPFDEMLSNVATEIKSIIPGDSAILLYDKNRKVYLAATTLEKSKLYSSNRGILINTAISALEDGELKNWSGSGSKILSVICLPLIMQDQKIGVIAAVNREDGKSFNKNDERLLEAIGSMMDTAIFEGLDKEKIKKALGRSVGADIMEEMLGDPNSDLVKPKRREITVLESDIRGFTALTERLDPDELAEFLNEHLGTMAQTVISCGGTVDKFVGDAVLALFNTPKDQKDHALLAVKTAFKMVQAHNDLLEKWSKKGIKTPIGVGIATGNPVVGEFGCDLRTDYTALGKTVNRACRLNGAAQGNQVLIWPSTYEIIKDQIEVEAIEGMTFKGIGDLVAIYRVLSIKD
uniref:Guanylate cyclase domain-containing protein n=1 Tax=candidate division CPR3 bacterium TaxID=2268181 RepID=A0A7C4R2W8_UNCC3